MEICAQKEGEWRSISIFFQVVQKAGTELIKYCVLYSPFDNKENEDEVGFLRWWIQFCLIKSQNDRRGFRGSSSAEVAMILLELETKVKRRFAKIVQSRRRPLLGPSPSWKRLMIIALASQFHVYLSWVNAHLACECAFNPEKALVSVGLLRDCKIFATLRLTFVSSSSNDEDNPSQKHGT